MLHLPHSSLRSGQKLQLSGSKSESNRALILQALYPTLQIQNLSTADDTLLLAKALQSNEEIIDIHHAGTAMRFLTAYFAAQEGREVLLTGSSRMKERPIGVLVEALRQMGADIRYVENDGFPPLCIRGKKLSAATVRILGHLSSQYLSALLLIAPALPHGLHLQLVGKVTSMPYLKMTLSFLSHCLGEAYVKVSWPDIHIAPLGKAPLAHPYCEIESDWSSASYGYSFIALSPIGTTLQLSSLKPNSLQGDSALIQLYEPLGVKSTFVGNTLHLRKVAEAVPFLETDLNPTPDLAQTLAVTCLGLGIACHLTGLHTLKIKETDRLQALYNEMTKLGGTVHISDDSLKLSAGASLRTGITIHTYHDHRMAMAFAPLMLKTSLNIEDEAVVSKSYPAFWEDVQKLQIKK